MAGNGKRGGPGDRVLESRHLVGLFLGVVLLCAVFFTLGYFMGRTQYTGAVVVASTTKTLAPFQPAAKPTGKLIPEANPTAEPAWPDAEPTKPADKHVETHAPSKPTATPPPGPNKESKNSKATPAPKALPRFQPPPVAKNAIVLQVAATKQQRDALEMADVLQKKKFTSFVTSSSADNFYHVQVGPYPDVASAEKARHALEQLGFKSIIKH